MKKLLSIGVALAVMLSMLIAVPAGAVTQGSITVTVDEPLAEVHADYTIVFHNDGLLMGDDDQFIDVMFPLGTDVTDFPVTVVDVFKGTEAAQTVAVTTTFTLVGEKTIRIRLDAGEIIDKCDWVRIEIEDVLNPKSCDYHLQIGTSVAGPYASADYRIFTLKIPLLAGKNLISLPAYPEKPEIESVLAALFARAAAVPTFTFSVWTYDAWAEEWLIYASDTSFSSLTEMHAGKAYWIQVNQAITFMFKGVPYPVCEWTPEKWKFPACWNMIGIATTTPTAASEYLFDTMLLWPHQNTYAVSTIMAFDATAGVQQYFDTGWRPGLRDNPAWMGEFVAPDLPTGQPEPPYQDVLLKPGKGYFMSFLGEAFIVPPTP